MNKLAKGLSIALVGVTAIATVATAGCAAPVLAAAIAVTSGVTCVGFGAAEVVESFTGHNVIRDDIMGGNEELYNTVRTVVEDFHTYFVGDNGVLVHNSCNHNYEWAKERKRFWKDMAQKVEEGVDYGSFVATIENIKRMVKGLAPIGWDDFSVQLHHWEGIANNFYNYSPLSRTLHQIIHSLR